MTATLLATFASLDAAADCAVAVATAGASACELLDRTYLDVAERTSTTGIAASAQAVLLIEVEAQSSGELRSVFDRIVGIAQRSGAMELSPASELADVERVWALRHAASPTLARLPASTRSMQFIEDGCVPPEHFADYVRGVRSALARSDTTGVIFGHAGDAHAHVNPLIDLTRRDWRDTVRRLFDDVVDLTARLGGTLAGEHGDGRLRAHALERAWSTVARAAFANIKHAADPSGILNPGCKVAAPMADPFDTIRYDPSLPPLPAAVQHALDTVERERAWHRFRLDLA
jgi:FAD/FMN-containing dehydrogenase